MLLHQPVEAEIRHHGDGHELDAELRRQDGEDLIPVHDLARRVDREHPVAVAVERDSEVESGVDDRPAQGGEVGRAAAFVDVRPVGIGADRGHLGAERRERLGRDPRVGAVCAVDHDSAARRDRSRNARPRARDSCRSRRRRGRSCRRRGSGASSSASISASERSVSLWPSASKNLTPLYSGGLCEAVITTPRSSARSATAGVGSTPASTAFPPAATTPRANASSSSGPDARVSRPTKTRPPAAPERRSLAEPLDELDGQILPDDPANTVRAEEAAIRQRGATAWRTGAPCAPCAARPSCARPGVRRASGSPRA